MSCQSAGCSGQWQRSPAGIHASNAGRILLGLGLGGCVRGWLAAQHVAAGRPAASQAARLWPLVTMPPRSTPTNLRDHHGRRCDRCGRCGCCTLPPGGGGTAAIVSGRGVVRTRPSHGAGQSAGAFTAPTGQRVFCSPARHLGLFLLHFTSFCACSAAPPQPHGPAPDRPRVASAMGSTANPSLPRRHSISPLTAPTHQAHPQTYMALRRSCAVCLMLSISTAKAA
eukprot:COSAG01_NODE_1513_length_10065_cov_63.160144_8_plen_226_part_00